MIILHPAPVYTISQSFAVPDSIPDGTYYIAMGILDYSTKTKPAIRFAMNNYFNGGWHPMGYVGVNQTPVKTNIDPALFDDILSDPLFPGGQMTTPPITVW